MRKHRAYLCNNVYIYILGKLYFNTSSHTSAETTGGRISLPPPTDRPGIYAHCYDVYYNNNIIPMTIVIIIIIIIIAGRSRPSRAGDVYNNKYVCRFSGSRSTNPRIRFYVQGDSSISSAHPHIVFL